MNLSLSEARRIIITSQKLSGFSRKGKPGVLSLIEHLGYVQIDTLSVVMRAHHHTLWSRLSDYKPDFLDQCLKEKKIFEYWHHAASYLPMNHYRYSLPRKVLYATGKAHWFKQDKKIERFVLDRIKAEGPLQSKDFEQTRKKTTAWYEWKPAKRALEQLFMAGKLMVAERNNFQKVYDLPERVLPPNIDLTIPSEDEYGEYLILSAIAANGIVMATEIGYLQGQAKASIAKNIKRLLKEGVIEEIRVSQGNGLVYYGLVDQCESILNMNAKQRDDRLHILSPFDNLVIQRKRLQQLFDFSYMLECYLPAAKRQYGYFCLPVLYEDAFVARIDAKADRAHKTLDIHSFHTERGFQKTDIFKETFTEKLKFFAAANGCEVVNPCKEVRCFFIKNRI